jgi:inhibitor of cysteine peptidase
VEVDPGATLTLRLDSNPSTGYMWAIREVSDPAVVHLVADEYVAPDTDDVGAAGAQLLTFETLAPGTADVQLWYIRSFEDPPVPADEASFIVQVTG